MDAVQGIKGFQVTEKEESIPAPPKEEYHKSGP